jgi:hypothetical protein
MEPCIDEIYGYLDEAFKALDKQCRVNDRKERLRKRFGEIYPQLKVRKYPCPVKGCEHVALSYREKIKHVDEKHKVWLFFHKSYKHMID